MTEVSLSGSGPLGVLNWGDVEPELVVRAARGAAPAARLVLGLAAADAHPDNDVSGDELSPERILLQLWPGPLARAGRRSAPGLAEPSRRETRTKAGRAPARAARVPTGSGRWIVNVDPTPGSLRAPRSSRPSPRRARGRSRGRARCRRGAPRGAGRRGRSGRRRGAGRPRRCPGRRRRPRAAPAAARIRTVPPAGVERRRVLDEVRERLERPGRDLPPRRRPARPSRGGRRRTSGRPPRAARTRRPRRRRGRAARTDRERAATQSGEVEQVADEPLEPPRLALDHRARAGRLEHAVLERLGMAADRGERRLELVADGEEERPLGLLGSRRARPRGG